MLANRESTANTMLRALATTLGALDAAADVDVDRSDEDRQFFAAERDALQPRFDALNKADQDATTHAHLVALRKQARIVVGDAVLDRGVSKAKARMKVELRDTKEPKGADHVFGVDVGDIINAERAEEPNLVLQAVARFAKVPDFAGKTQMAADLTARAKKQQQCFTDRAEAAVIEAQLDSALTKAIEDAAGALYGLEKRLLERFSYETRYVKAFFLDIAPSKPKKEDGKKADEAKKAEPKADEAKKADAKPDAGKTAEPKADEAKVEAKVEKVDDKPKPIS